MPCPMTILQVQETSGEFRATLEGELGDEAAGLLRGLCERVRGKRKKRIVLDISAVKQIHAKGVDGVRELEKAAEHGKNTFELRAPGATAADKLCTCHANEHDRNA
jgi:hypothetical protein